MAMTKKEKAAMQAAIDRAETLADQLRAYALAEVEKAVKAERERCANLCESMHEEDGPHAYAWRIRTEWSEDAKA